MEDAKYQVGDLVILKSRGPLMTVVEVCSSSIGIEYVVYWFDRHVHLCDAMLPENSLMLYAEEDEEGEEWKAQ